MKQLLPKWVYAFLYSYVTVATAAVACIFTAGSLLTFDPQDPSWWHQSTQHMGYHNMFEGFGAYYSAFLLYIFGKASYILIPFFAYLGVFFYYHYSWKKELDRFLGWVFLLTSACLVCFVYKIDSYQISSPGGIYGYAVANITLVNFDLLAQKIVLFFVVGISIVMVLQISFLQIIHFCIRFFAYATRKDSIFAYIAHGLWIVSRAIINLCSTIIVKIFHVLSGKVVEKSALSVAHFERDEKATGQSDTILHDIFWEAYLDNKTHQVFKVSSAIPESGMPDTDAQKNDNEAEDVKIAASEPLQKVQHYDLPDAQSMPLSAMPKQKHITEETLQQQATILEKKLELFDIQGKVVKIHPGPVVTLFEYMPESHVKLSKIIALEDDLAMALQAVSIRILAPIPGTPVVGFEVANRIKESVRFADIVQSKEFQNNRGALPLILGQDPLGMNVIVDLASMPHLLIAGSTGSGKSVALNAMLVSLLCKFSPDELKLIIIDPKRLEFAAYQDIAHLIFPIVTDSRKAFPVLKWVVSTMEQRYEIMAAYGVRNIGEYHALRKDAQAPQMPFMVVIIDELADLMMTTGREIEETLARIAQMARAAGIHVIIATQRPSVDVITGIIKVNFTARISFKVTSKVDSRTILDDVGAEKLLGRGDMLFMHGNDPHIRRVHGAYITDQEIEFVVQSIKKQRAAQYLDLQNFLQQQQQDDILLENDDNLYKDIMSFVQDCDEISISLLQRQFRIGYNRSARIIAKLEADGIILPSDGGKMRRVLK